MAHASYRIPGGGEFARKTLRDLQGLHDGRSLPESEKTGPLYSWLSTRLERGPGRVNIAPALQDAAEAYDHTRRAAARDRDRALSELHERYAARIESASGRSAAALRGAQTKAERAIVADYLHTVRSAAGRKGSRVRALREEARAARPYNVVRLHAALIEAGSLADDESEWVETVSFDIDVPTTGDALDQLVGSNGAMWQTMRPEMKRNSPFVWIITGVELASDDAELSDDDDDSEDE